MRLAEALPYEEAKRVACSVQARGVSRPISRPKERDTEAERGGRRDGGRGVCGGGWRWNGWRARARGGEGGGTVAGLGEIKTCPPIEWPATPYPNEWLTAERARWAGPRERLSFCAHSSTPICCR